MACVSNAVTPYTLVCSTHRHTNNEQEKKQLSGYRCILYMREHTAVVRAIMQKCTRYGIARNAEKKNWCNSLLTRRYVNLKHMRIFFSHRALIFSLLKCMRSEIFGYGRTVVNICEIFFHCIYVVKKIYWNFSFIRKPSLDCFPIHYSIAFNYFVFLFCFHSTQKNILFIAPHDYQHSKIGKKA